MEDPAEVRARAGADLSALNPAPESRAGLGIYSRDDTSPWLSELGRQIWDLPDGRIIFASVILCVCVSGWRRGWRAKAGKSRDRSGSFKIHTRSLFAHSGYRRLAPY